MMLRDYILHNFWWKLLSLLLAGLTWLTIETAFRKDEARRESPVIPGASVRIFAAVPITLLAATTNTNRFRVDPSTVPVEITGNSNELFRLQMEEIKAYVDISDAGEQKEFRRPIQTQVPGDLRATPLIHTNVSVERIVVAKQP